MRNATPVALLMIDADDFKLSHVSHGHQAGDEEVRVAFEHPLWPGWWRRGRRQIVRPAGEDDLAVGLQGGSPGH